MNFSEMARTLIAHYPLYGDTEHISDEQAIQIALVIFDDITQWEDLCNLVK